MEQAFRPAILGSPSTGLAPEVLLLPGSLTLRGRKENQHHQFFLNVVKAVFHFRRHKNHATRADSDPPRPPACAPARAPRSTSRLPMRLLRIDAAGRQCIHSRAHRRDAQKLQVRLPCLRPLLSIDQSEKTLLSFYCRPERSIYSSANETCRSKDMLMWDRASQTRSGRARLGGSVRLREKLLTAKVAEKHREGRRENATPAARFLR